MMRKSYGDRLRDCIEKYPGLMATELADRTGITQKKVRVALNDLEHRKAVHKLGHPYRWYISQRSIFDLDRKYGGEKMAVIRAKWIFDNWIDKEFYGDEDETGASKARKLILAVDDIYTSVQKLDGGFWIRMEPVPVFDTPYEDVWTIKMFMYCGNTAIGRIQSMVKDTNSMTISIYKSGLKMIMKINGCNRMYNAWDKVAIDHIPVITKKLEDLGLVLDFVSEITPQYPRGVRGAKAGGNAGSGSADPDDTHEGAGEGDVQDSSSS